MSDDSRLQRIQRLQFTDRPTAEALLLDFVREVFPALGVDAAELRPLAVSLNSFNGYLHLKDGRRLFFKSHVEPHSIVSEYYNADLLAGAGYPVIRPLHVSTEYGKQFLIYDLVESPSVFDVARAIEQGQRDDLEVLAAAQAAADDQLCGIYLKTLSMQSAEEAARAPIHQLFHHRLGARYTEFYAGKTFALPGGALRWEELLERRWRINGFSYKGTLGEAIERARTLLNPAQAGWSVIGHGDAHNGNVFLTPEGLVYFDPAFSGRHHPLLDLAKPMFHNVFAAWMYHPQEEAARRQIEWHDDGQTITVEHNQRRLSKLRLMFSESKMRRVVDPLITALQARENQPRKHYITLLSAAMLCCPLLTMNLADRVRFPAPIGLLGLCWVVQVGMELETRWVV